MTSTEQLEAQIAQQRQALAETADALSAKLDVKARASEKATELKDSVTTDSGRPRTSLVAIAIAVAAAAGALVWWRRRG